MIELEKAAKLYDIYQRAFGILCEAYEVLGDLPDGSERDEAVLDHGKATDAVLFGLRERLLVQYPELEASVSEDSSEASLDPLAEVVDESLVIDAGVLDELAEFRSREKLVHLPGGDLTSLAAERERLSGLLNGLVDALLEGISINPTNQWVMAQFQRSLIEVEQEDSEAKEHFGMELEFVMRILGIEGSDGLLSFYLGGL